MAINLLKLIRIVFSFQIFVAHTESGVSEPSDPSDPILCDSEVEVGLISVTPRFNMGLFPNVLIFSIISHLQGDDCDFDECKCDKGCTNPHTNHSKSIDQLEVREVCIQVHYQLE